MNLEKMLMLEQPSITFEKFKGTHELNAILPELNTLINCPQNPHWHPEGDVWNHTMLVIDGAAKIKEFTSNQLGFMYSALLHDIGKPATTKLNKHGSWSALGHEFVGAKMIPEIMQRFTNDETLMTYVRKMTRNHMYAHKILDMRDIKLRRLMIDFNAADLLLFGVADRTYTMTTVETFTATQYVEKYNRLASLSEELFIKKAITMNDLQGYENADEVYKQAIELQALGMNVEKVRKKLLIKG